LKIPNYNIIKEIGAGSMGTVYLAEHTLIKRKVAIKSLKQDLIKNDQLRERFKKEATALAQLEHPNIVRLNEYIEQQDGIFLIMEFVDGLALDQHINTVTGPVNEDNLVPLFSQLLDAFEYAHKNKIVHRDIKPSNIIITKDGKVKVLDFGIAKIMDETSSMTKTGTQMGTVFYMSPEQVRGEKVNHLSDIYSLGVTLFQMATGKAPYDPTSNEYQVFQKIDKEPLPDASTIYPGVSNKINAIIQKATAKDGKERFQSCGEFKTTLLNVENETYNTKAKIDDLKKTVIKEIPKEKKKKKNLVYLILMLLIIIGGFYGFQQYKTLTHQLAESKQEVNETKIKLSEKNKLIKEKAEKEKAEKEKAEKEMEAAVQEMEAAIEAAAQEMEAAAQEMEAPEKEKAEKAQQKREEELIEAFRSSTNINLDYKYKTTFKNNLAFEVPLRKTPNPLGRKIYICPKNSDIYVLSYSANDTYYFVSVDGFFGYISKTQLKRHY
tara:strand:+ start:27 stop:1505 length:1479 start_codon:yes stop_codon:yes gene_type:complete